MYDHIDQLPENKLKSGYLEGLCSYEVWTQLATAVIHFLKKSSRTLMVLSSPNFKINHARGTAKELNMGAMHGTKSSKA